MSNTCLLTWNPAKWDFEGGYHSFLKQVNAGEKPVLEWRAANSSIQKGDVMYLMRLGANPRGILLNGIALRLYLILQLALYKSKRLFTLTEPMVWRITVISIRRWSRRVELGEKTELSDMSAAGAVQLI